MADPSNNPAVIEGVAAVQMLARERFQALTKADCVEAYREAIAVLQDDLRNVEGPMQTCHRCEGDGLAHGSDRPFESKGPGSYPGPCPVCKGTGLVPETSPAATPAVPRSFSAYRCRLDRGFTLR